MKSHEKQLITRWTVAAYVCISAALVLLVLLAIWGGYRELKLVHLQTLRPELDQLRTSALRTVGHIESTLAEQEDPSDLTVLEKDPWLQQRWQEIVAERDQHTYAAIVDRWDVVVLHTNPALQGRLLEGRWYDWSLLEAGADVVETRSGVLAGGQRAYDIQVPIMVNGTMVGEYHAGFQAEWFDEQVRSAYFTVFRRWVLILTGVLLMVGLAALSLYYLAIRKLALGQAVSNVQSQRVMELGQLASGLAHEIRNPLHAIRLNLHALQRMQSNGHMEVPKEELHSIIRDANQEIDRVDRLMRQLVEFASPDKPCEQTVDLVREVESSLRFMGEELKRKQVTVNTHFPEGEANVYIDPSRLRQILLNLLNNAVDAVNQGGRIEVAIENHPARVDLSVTDDGPGISSTNVDRVFEPFFSTKAGASGLGLAQVRRYVGEAGGEVRCESNGARGATFRVTLPARVKSTRDRAFK